MSGLHLGMIVSYLPDFLSGAWLTLEIGLVSLSLGTALGLLLSLTRRSPHRLLSWPSYVYIEFFRTTPPLIQIVWLYYGLPLLLGFDLGAFGAAALALGLNIAAFFAEIFRAGIAAVDRTQWQAAQMLGLGRTDTFHFVILPQALRNVLPPMGTTVIYLIKDTALASAIGTPELLRIGQLVANETFLPVEALTIVAVIYFLVTYPIAFGFHALERRLSTTRA